MTLYGTGVRRTELTRLKVSDIDSRRMGVHIQGGEGEQDRDVMLSPVLLGNCVLTGDVCAKSERETLYQALTNPHFVATPHTHQDR